MAGINQHNIPQFLLRGFRAPGGTKKRSKIWVFETEVPPRLLFIRAVAAEDYFYSEPSIDSSKTLDDEITDHEQWLGRRIQDLRAVKPGDLVDAHIAAELVAHLTIRNAHLRRSFGGGMQRLFDRSVELFCNEEKLRAILGVDERRPSAAIVKAVDEELATNPALATVPLPSNIVYQVAQMTLRERFKRSFSEQIPFMERLFENLAEQAPEFVRKGHNKALSAGCVGGPRVDLLSELSWSVHSAPDTGFVLPDCVALGANSRGEIDPLIMVDLKTVTAVLFPISTTRMLVGVRPGQTVPSLDGFNQMAAISSHQFFVGAHKRFQTFSEFIGGATRRFVRESVDVVLEEFCVSHQAALNRADENMPAAVHDRPAAASAPQYPIKFIGCADQPTSERIAAILYAMTAELCRVMPLDRLDGMTLAHDYPVALCELDRGFAATSVSPTQEEYAVGIAMSPLVIRAGLAKRHIVMRGDIGHWLLSENETDRRFALHTTVQQLALVACTQIVDETLPGALFGGIEDNYEAFLHPCVNAAWSGYFSSRASATFSPDIGQGYLEILRTVLNRARNEILPARLAYRFHGDIDELLAVALPRIEEVLRFSAKVLGHYDGLQREALDDKSLAEILQELGLYDWFLLFGGELSLLCSRVGRWSSVDEFLTLNRHVERLLWQFGLFPWKTENGEIRVEVPLATDADQLA